MEVETAGGARAVATVAGMGAAMAGKTVVPTVGVTAAERAVDLAEAMVGEMGAVETAEAATVVGETVGEMDRMREIDRMDAHSDPRSRTRMQRRTLRWCSIHSKTPDRTNPVGRVRDRTRN